MKQILTSWLPGSKRAKTEHHYPFSSIWINGREVSIEKIEKEVPRSPFEETTFHFIHDWLSGVENFKMLTSGSTGPPKTITVTRAQMRASALRTSAKLSLLKNTKALVCIDTKYIGGKMMLVRCFTSGMHITAVDPVANPFVNIPVDNCVQFTAVVPYQITEVLESKHPHLLNNFDRVIIGGASLGARNQEQLQRFQCACYETYGMTETVSHVALRLINTELKQPYFETLPGVLINVDERDCLIIHADYLGKPVITNDVIKLVDKNKFIWLGRWDTVINSGGVKVIPESVERTVQKIFINAGISNRFFIAGLPDERLGNKIVLILEGVQFSSEKLQRSFDVLKSSIPAFEVPKAVYHVPTFVMTQNQKIDRNQTLLEAILLSSFK